MAYEQFKNDIDFPNIKVRDGFWLDTATLRLDLFSQTNATGDIFYRGSDGYVKALGIGTAGQVLTVAGGLPTWITGSSSGNETGFSLSTTGSSGAATLIDGVLNIPNYTYTLPAPTGNALGGVKAGANITIAEDGTISSSGGSSVAAPQGEVLTGTGTGYASSSSFVFDGNKLAIVAPAISSTRENIFSIKVADDSTSVFQIANGTTTNARFAPTLAGYASNSANPGLMFRGLVTSGSDTGTQHVIEFQTARTTNTSNPNDGTLSSIVTRPLFLFSNQSDPILKIFPDRSVMAYGLVGTDTRLMTASATGVHGAPAQLVWNPTTNNLNIGGSLSTSGTVTAASALGRAINFAHTINPIATNDILSALDINPVFGNAFGSNKYGLRILNTDAQVQIANLGGTGDRMVVTDASGNLKAQAIPSGNTGSGFTINNPSAGRVVLANNTSTSADASPNLIWNDTNKGFEAAGSGYFGTPTYGNNNLTVTSAKGDFSILVDGVNNGGDTILKYTYRTGAQGKLLINNAAGNVATFGATNGNFGLGTTDPQYNIDVHRNGVPTVRLRNAAAAADNNYSQLIFETNNGATSNSQAIIIGQSLVAGSNDSRLLFYTSEGTNGAIPQVTINPAGNLGVGTLFPDNKLDVRNTGVMQIRMGTEAGARPYWQLGRDNVTTGQFIIADETNVKVRITNDGKMAIGDVTPDAKLHVRGNVVIDDGSLGRIVLENATNENRLYSEASGFSAWKAFGVYSNGSSSLPSIYANTAGNVGIGSNAPAYKLQVAGTIHSYDDNGVADGQIMVSTKGGATNIFLNSAGDSYILNDLGVGVGSPAFKLDVANGMRIGGQGGNDYTLITGGSGQGSHIYQHDTGGNVKNLFSASLNSYITGGRLGIGTTGPTQLLDVRDGNIRVGADAYPQYIGKAPDLIGGTGAADFGIRSETGAIVFGSGTTERMRIMPSGKVGINNASPSSMLTITDAAGTLFLDGGTVTSNRGDGLFIHNPNAVRLTTGAGATDRFYIDNNGQVAIGTIDPVKYNGNRFTVDNGKVKITDLGGSGTSPVYAQGDGTLVRGNSAEPGVQKLILAQTVPLSVVNQSGEITIYTATIPGGLMGNSGYLHWEGFYEFPNTANSKTLKVKINGNIVNQIGSTGNTSFKFQNRLVNVGDTGVQIHGGIGTASGTSYGNSGTVSSSRNIDTLQPMTVTITLQNVVSTESSTLKYFYLWYCYWNTALS